MTPEHENGKDHAPASSSPPHEGSSDVLFDSVLLNGIESNYYSPPPGGVLCRESFDPGVDLVYFPMPSLDNLERLLVILRDAAGAPSKEMVSLSLQEALGLGEGLSDWLSQLGASYEIACVSHMDETLSVLFEIVRNVVLCSSPSLLMRLVRNDIYEEIFGILEHDPDIPIKSRKNHFEIVKNDLYIQSTITRSDVIEKLHISYRLNYMRDSIFARMLDDYSFMCFNQAIQMLNGYIVNYFVANDSSSSSGADLILFISESANRHSNSAGSIQSNSLHILKVIQSLVNAGRGMLMDEKSPLSVSVASDKFLCFIEDQIASEVFPNSVLATECLLAIVGISSFALTALRIRCLHESKKFVNDHIMNELHKRCEEDVVQPNCTQSSPTSLLSSIIHFVVHGGSDHNILVNESAIAQSMDLLRTLMDSNAGGSLAESIVSKFYEEEYFEDLCAGLELSKGGKSNHPGSPSIRSFSMQCILDFVASCVTQHPVMAKNHFLRLGSLIKSVRLILTVSQSSTPSRVVQLAALRFVRALLWQKEILFFRNLTAFNIPSLVIQLLYLHRPEPPDTLHYPSGNMIYSSCLEIITFVCVNNQTHVMESLCRPGSESERLVFQLSSESHMKAHSELFQYIIATVDRLRHPSDVVEDIFSRQSITSSRGRSVSPAAKVFANLSADQPNYRQKKIRFSTASP